MTKPASHQRADAIFPRRCLPGFDRRNQRQLGNPQRYIVSPEVGCGNQWQRYRLRISQSFSGFHVAKTPQISAPRPELVESAQTVAAHRSFVLVMLCTKSVHPRLQKRTHANLPGHRRLMGTPDACASPYWRDAGEHARGYRLQSSTG